jgi:hypothetical protein
VPAVRCDLDHRQAFHTAGGVTVPANLDTLCRTHHRLKHETDWTTTAEPDGTLRWTAPSGRTYRSDPADHHGEDPALNAYLAAASARRQQTPPPPSPTTVGSSDEKPPF